MNYWQNVEQVFIYLVIKQGRMGTETNHAPQKVELS